MRPDLRGLWLEDQDFYHRRHLRQDLLRCVERIQLLAEANVNFAYAIETLLQKDSLDLDDADRALIRRAVKAADEDRIVITHGTDTMVETARALEGIDGKTIVLFGAMQPARMRYTDAMYNLGVATAAVQLLPPGVHLAMNGQIFAPDRVRKNRERGRFEPLDD